MSKPNKFERDFASAESFRRKVEEKLNKNGVHLQRVHTYMKWLGVNRARNNFTSKRIIDQGDDERMGFDYKININGKSSSRYLLIRKFSDYSLYIKESSERNLISTYKNENAIFLIVDNEVNYYKLLTMNRVLSLGWYFKNISPSNKNRYDLLKKDGKIVNPNKHLSQNKINGDNLLLRQSLDFWTAIKKIH